MNTYIFIHGGESFATQSEFDEFLTTTLVDWNLEAYTPKEPKKKWKKSLADELSTQGNLVYMPNFPNQIGAKYNEWKQFFDIWLGKIEIQGKLVLIGHSLGGCFLLKYFSERETFPYTVKQIHLIASCIQAGDFTAPGSYRFLGSMGTRIHIWHAEDDLVVPFSDAEKISEYLPEASTHFFGSEKGYGHFHTLGEFYELTNILSE